MRRLRPATWFLILFWTLYGVAVALTLYRASPSVNRDLALILGAYSVAMGLVTGVILFRAWLRRLHREGT
jgi:hypothetical protein